MAVFSLGTFTFFSCGAPGDHATGPAALQASGTILSRGGVPGACVVQTGIQTGKQFDFESLVDVATIAAATTLHGEYRAKVYTDHLKLVWQDYDYDTINQRFVVTNVGQPTIWTPAASCGGLNNGPVWLKSRWSLVASPSS